MSVSILEMHNLGEIPQLSLKKKLGGFSKTWEGTNNKQSLF